MTHRRAQATQKHAGQGHFSTLLIFLFPRFWRRADVAAPLHSQWFVISSRIPGHDSNEQSSKASRKTIPCSVAVIVGGFFGSSGVPAGQSRRLPAGAASAGPTERRTRQGPLPLGTGIRTAFVPKRQKTPTGVCFLGGFFFFLGTCHCHCHC